LLEREELWFALIPSAPRGLTDKTRKPFDKIAEGLSHLNWLPIVDEFRNFLMSEEASIIGYQIKDFNVLVEE